MKKTGQLRALHRKKFELIFFGTTFAISLVKAKIIEFIKIKL
jgi:hypothetical protein